MTKQDLAERLKQHKKNAENNQKGHFYYAIRKYGWDDFTTEILEETVDLTEREQYWISHYNTFLGDGYNMTPGGEGGAFFGTDNGMFGKTHPPSVKKIMSAVTRQEWIDGVYDNRDLTGKNNGMYGKVPARNLKTGLKENVDRSFFWKHKYNPKTHEGFLVGSKSKVPNF